MSTSKTGKRYPVISIVLFVFAGVAFLLCLYFTISAIAAPATINSSLTAFSAAFGPMVNMIRSVIMSAVSGALAIIAVLNLLVGVLLLAMGMVLRSHRDLAARVEALEVGKNRL